MKILGRVQKLSRKSSFEDQKITLDYRISSGTKQPDFKKHLDISFHKLRSSLTCLGSLIRASRRLRLHVTAVA